MNHRTFLKSLTAACGAAIVCPGKLLKRTKHTFIWVPPNEKMPTHRIKVRYKGTEPLLAGEPVIWGDEEKTFVVKAIFAGVISETT